MKKIFLILLSFLVQYTKAQVKFTCENVKSKTANVVYIGQANTFKINASQEISVTNITPSQGNVRMNADGSFCLYVHEITEKPVELKYTQTKNGVETEVVYPTRYTVKKAPEKYQVKVGEFTSGGIVTLDKMRKNFKVSLIDEGINVDIKNYVIRFYFLYQPYKKDPLEVNYNSTDKESIKAYNSMFSNLQEGDRLFYENIEISFTDGTSKKQDAINFRLKK